MAMPRIVRRTNCTDEMLAGQTGSCLLSARSGYGRGTARDSADQLRLRTDASLGKYRLEMRSGRMDADVEHCADRSEVITGDEKSRDFRFALGYPHILRYQFFGRVNPPIRVEQQQYPTRVMA
jgi:hypothetical protein